MSTLKDVAKLAGVSTSTVSRTLSNRVFVEEETKKKVLKAVEELNYRPNIAAKGLKSGKTFMMGFMVPDINSVFYPMIMKSIERYAAEVGYSLILMNNEENIKKEKQALQSFMGRGVDGILCMSVEDDISHLEEFQKNQKIPVVLVNRTASKDMSSVSIDNEHGGYLMTKYLLEQGHTKISGVFGDFSRQRFRERYDGCKRAMEEYGIRDYKKYFIYDVDSIEEAYLRTVEILKSEDRPTAFFAMKSARPSDVSPFPSMARATTKASSLMAFRMRSPSFFFTSSSCAGLMVSGAFSSGSSTISNL